ncbi:unnamed protein product [Parnassius apollo]|uniref:(apollo) hypothetical protein n=1 Tax=Parnassius apollo TaxID=110799 RepID=A0A8S3WFY0_PARAO|nr:unnamed protein product [Parnassius apollo]
MEFKRTCKWPGGRQGASGAGAGRVSCVQSTARPPSSLSHSSSPPAGLVPAESSWVQQSVTALVEYVACNGQSKFGKQVGGFAYRTRMHRLFTDLEPSITVTEQNLADRVQNNHT